MEWKFGIDAWLDAGIVLAPGWADANCFGNTVLLLQLLFISFVNLKIQPYIRNCDPGWPVIPGHGRSTRLPVLMESPCHGRTVTAFNRKPPRQEISCDVGLKICKKQY